MNDIGKTRRKMQEIVEQRRIDEEPSSSTSESDNLISDYLAAYSTNQSPTAYNEKWQNFCDLLNDLLDVYTYRETRIIVEDFMKLESILNSECQSNEIENQLYFVNQRQIIDFLSQNLKVII